MRIDKCLLALLCISAVMLGGYGGWGDESRSDNETSKAVYRKISSAQAKAMMDDGNPYILIDVRTEREHSTQHIKGAVLIPDNEIRLRAESELPDKNARILVYCHSGNRSAAVARTLVSLGYTSVYDMGGIMSWHYGTVSK